MMSRVIQQETQVFLLAVLFGGGLTVLYDLLRVLRRVFPHGLTAVSIEDFLFWMTAAFCTFCFAFSQTAGVIRGYVAVGMALGACLYHFAASSFVVAGLAGLLRWFRTVLGLVFLPIKKAVSAVGRAGMFPARIFCRKWKKGIEIARKKRYNKQYSKNEEEKLRKKPARRGDCVRRIQGKSQKKG